MFENYFSIPRNTSPVPTKKDVVDVEYSILFDKNFRKQGQYNLKHTIPIVMVLQLVNSEARDSGLYL